MQGGEPGEEPPRRDVRALSADEQLERPSGGAPLGYKATRRDLRRGVVDRPESSRPGMRVVDCAAPTGPVHRSGLLSPVIPVLRDVLRRSKGLDTRRRTCSRERAEGVVPPQGLEPWTHGLTCCTEFPQPPTSGLQSGLYLHLRRSRSGAPRVVSEVPSRLPADCPIPRIVTAHGASTSGSQGVPAYSGGHPTHFGAGAPMCSVLKSVALTN